MDKTNPHIFKKKQFLSPVPLALSTPMFTQHTNYRLTSDMLFEESILFFSDLELESKNGTSSLALSSMGLIVPMAT